MDKLPSEILVMIAENLRQGPELVIPLRRAYIPYESTFDLSSLPPDPYRPRRPVPGDPPLRGPLLQHTRPLMSEDEKAKYFYTTKAWKKLDWSSCLNWDFESRENWVAVIQTLLDLLNFSLTGRKYHVIVHPVMRQVLDLIMNCIIPPWRTGDIVYATNESGVQADLSQYLESITRLDRHFHRWAARKTAPPDRYRIKRFTKQTTRFDYDTWAQRLGDDRFYMPDLGRYGTSTHYTPDFDPLCLSRQVNTEPLALHMFPKRLHHHEPAGILFLLRSLINEIIEIRYLTRTDEFEILLRRPATGRAPTTSSRMNFEGHQVQTLVTLNKDEIRSLD
ncbi:uncharacterized protein KY384_000777 [Bacidia gigantensis]|uniref:uncharacterized protein n=1 Tax=Bacidia gigantensis TaxID=2732470 RepID=UPI001D055B91|nr:uncharacterized protein KY384_000777 [Bacidia gigantensis]KAG8526015.1 hypothetical protein KY384_000777 [Bacidia gigantensis]